MATSTKQEVEQLKQQLNEKVGEFRDIYNKVVERGGEELPEDILDTVTGGSPCINPTKGPSANPTPPSAEEDR